MCISVYDAFTDYTDVFLSVCRNKGLVTGERLALPTGNNFFLAAAQLAIGDHGSTFGGNPLACAAANKVLEILTDGGLLESSAPIGEYFGERLAHFSKYNFIADIRGKGLMRGIQFIEKLPAAAIEGKLRERGYLVNVAGNNTIRLVPPLTIEKEQIDGLIAALDDVLASTNVI